MSAARQVRLATAADLGDVERLLRELGEHHARIQPGFFRPPRGLARGAAELRRMLHRPGEVVLLALEAGTVAGLVHLSVQETPPAPALAPRRRVYVEELIVAQGARRRGLGRLLMERARIWAEEQSAGQLVLTLWEGNVAAARFYERLGYRAVSSVLALELP